MTDDLSLEHKLMTMLHEPCPAFSDRFYELLIGEADASVRADFVSHRSECPLCAAAAQHAEAVIALATQLPSDPPSEVYWDTYLTRLEWRMARTESRASVRPLAAMREAISSRWSRNVLQIAAAVLLLVSGVLIGRYTLDDRAAVPPAAGRSSIDRGLVPAALNDRTIRYLDRTSVLLQGMANFDADADDPAAINVSVRQKVARALLDETPALNAALSADERLLLSELMGDLERILLQIANLEADVDLPSIELVQRGVDRGSLLMKINLAKMRMVEEQVSAVAPPDAL